MFVFKGGICVFNYCMDDVSKEQVQCKHDLWSKFKTTNCQQQAEIKTHQTELKPAEGTGGFPYEL